MFNFQRTETDTRHHPWPQKGKLFEIRFRKGIWFIVNPWYKNAKTPEFTTFDITKLRYYRFWFPFITWDFGFQHGYLFWKPIPVGTDPAFRWRDLTVAQEAIKNDELFVQLSFRPFGIGKIS